MPLVELRGMITHLKRGLQHAQPHAVMSLLGRFKNELGESYHLMPVLAVTPRGLKPFKWLGRVREKYKQRNITSGYMFPNADGTKLKIK
jgi:hypothetical protein